MRRNTETVLLQTNTEHVTRSTVLVCGFTKHDNYPTPMFTWFNLWDGSGLHQAGGSHSGKELVGGES